MRKQDLQKEKLDQTARRLLEAARISNEEIEQIVAAPQLFAAVKSGIKAEQRKTGSYSANWWTSAFWNWQKISAVGAAFALFVFGAVGFVFIAKSWQIDEQSAIVSAVQTEAEIIAPISEDFQETVETKNPEIKPQPAAQKKAFKKEVLRKPKPERKAPSAKSPSQTKTELASEFYALNYMGNPNETGEALRVVRTELSPSALFSLGVNVPIENAKEKIKTDLLVGADGVARAIRFVE